MLFDLRGRGRRRAVQAIYLSLALLMGGGLVLFGVGGATSGGLLDAFKADSGTANVSDVFKKRVDAAEKGVQLRPADPKAWAALTRIRYLEASSGDGVDQTQGVFTDKGKERLVQAETAWNKYVKLSGGEPSDDIASLMVQAFGTAGLNKPDEAVSAMEDVIAKRQATGPLYVQLVALAYQAGQTRKAELASKKALALTPKDDREQIKAQIDAARQQASAALGAAGTSTTATPTATATQTGPVAPTTP
jgi:tetratricopeptide (TPR) repeat protein